VKSNVDRRALLVQVLDELTAQVPGGLMRFMRRWPYGSLSLIHLQVLTILDGDGPHSMHALADALDVSQASATGIVDRMAQRGLVERVRDDDDRRVIRAALTDAGKSVVTGVVAERRERLASVLADLTDAELEGFLLGSRALRRARERHLARLPAEARRFVEAASRSGATAAAPVRPGRHASPEGARP
jgi:DNA-binding MarR family transcriptional regulator